MIRDIFEKILFMGSQAVPVIVIVFALRILLYRFHKKYLYFLWLLVAVRLVVPVSITSPMSMFRLFESIPMPGQSTVVTEKEQLSEVPAGRTTIKEKQTSGNEKQTERIKSDATGDFFVTNAGNNSDWENIWQIFLYVWLAGMAVFLVWNFFSFIQMQRRTKKAVRLEDNIWECENISSPFVVGVFRPKIYLPFRLPEEEKDFILCHEKHHIARKDNWIQLFAFFLVCIYWFHPLVWLSYFAMIRDMEMSCDEYVMSKSGKDIRAVYGRALLGFAMNKRILAAGSLCFGESGVRRRVKNIMTYRKNKKWMGAVAVVVFLLAGCSCLTDAVGQQDTKDAAQTESVSEKEKYTKSLAKAEIKGVTVEVMYASQKKIENNPKSMYYDDGEFYIQTKKGNDILDTMKLTKERFGVENKIAFTPEFSLQISDYDKDGENNDFSLGQGQTPVTELGNWMNYAFFGIGENGSIKQYLLGKNKTPYIATIPGGYSKAFDRKKKNILYYSLEKAEVASTYIALS